MHRPSVPLALVYLWVEHTFSVVLIAAAIGIISLVYFFGNDINTLWLTLKGIPLKGQVLKSNIGTIVTNKAKLEEVTKENSKLRKTLREKDKMMKEIMKEKDRELRMVRKQVRQNQQEEESMGEDLQDIEQKIPRK